MKSQKLVAAGIFLWLALFCGGVVFAEPAAISIQGKLQLANGSALTGSRTYRVRFYNAVTAGSQLGGDRQGTVVIPDSGRFSLIVTPPSQILNQSTVYYELAIDSAAVPDGITADDVFPTRVQVTSVPFARNAGQLGGTAAANYWKQGGNTVTTPSQQFLGTTNNSPFELYVNAQRALRLEPFGGSNNVILGSSTNVIDAGVIAGTIAGGGFNSQLNRVTDHSSVVGGGIQNIAGNSNADFADAHYATVAGGVNNRATADSATVGGGAGNIASGYVSTIPGGLLNYAGGYYSFAAGLRARAAHAGSFVWGDSTNVDTTTTAINQFLIRAGGGVGINKNNPAPGALDVNGDINFSGSLKGKAVRTDAASGLRVLRGIIGGDGAVFRGEGFTAIRNSIGNFTINYATPFPDYPAVTASSLNFGDTPNFVMLRNSDLSFCQIKFYNIAGALTDPVYFHLIVVGP